MHHYQAATLMHVAMSNNECAYPYAGLVSTERARPLKYDELCSYHSPQAVSEPTMDLLRAITNLPSLQILGGILGLFIAHFAVYQAYRIFIYPHYFSPLRHLPGPKVTGLYPRKCGSPQDSPLLRTTIFSSANPLTNSEVEAQTSPSCLGCENGRQRQ